MKKIKEPDVDDRFCDRCEKSYCHNCIQFEEVNFEIKEQINEHHPNPRAERFEVNWKGNDVCPWCYNQLLLKTKGDKP